MIEFTVEPSYDDYYASNRLIRSKAWAPRKIAKPALIMFGVATLVGQFVATNDGMPWREQLPYSLGIGIFGAGVWLLLCFGLGEFRLGAQTRKLYDQLGTISLPATFRIDSEALSAENAEGNSKHSWSRFQDYLLDERVLLLRRTDSMFFLIPVGQLSEGTLPTVIDTLGQVGVKRG
jgi:hypothetical protein